MNRSRAFQGLSVALLAVTSGLAAAFAGCGGGTTSTTSTGAGTTSGESTTSATSGTTTSSTSTGAGGSGGSTSATTSSASSTSSGSTGGAGGMGPCPSCTVISSLAGSAPVGPAVDANNVYWTHSGSSEVMQAKLDGSSPVTLAAAQSTPFSVKVAGGFVYWGSYSATGVVRKTPIGGGVITDIANSAAVREICVGANDLWWTNDPDDVQQIPLSGMSFDGGALVVATGNLLANGIATDGTDLYWVNRGTGEIKRSDLNPLNSYAPGSGDVPWDIEVDAKSVYWTEAGSPPAKGTVSMSVKPTGTDSLVPVVIASGQAAPHGIAIDATHVYWANSGDGTIHKAPIGGGTDTVLVSGQMKPENVVVDSKYVYWTDPKADLVVRALK